MASKSQASIERRVRLAAQAVLDSKGYVSAIDVLVGMGLLTRLQVDQWRGGTVPYLERVVGAGLGTISRSMKALRAWAVSQGLRPSGTAYLRRTGEGRKVELRFSKSGRLGIERAYRTHYVGSKRPAEARS